MKEVQDINEIFWPWVYEGIDEATAEAIFHNTMTGLYITKPRLDEVWDGDVLVLSDQARPANPSHPFPEMRAACPATEFRFPPGSRLKFPKQRQFLRLLDKYELLSFGGAGGTGKSIMLQHSHTWKHLKWREKNVYGVKSGMFCETVPDLLDRQISNIPEWIPEYLGEWKEQKKQFEFRKKWGSGIEMYRTTADTMRLRSIEFGHTTCDEGTQNPESVLDDIGSRLRSPKVAYPSFGLSSNPGGIGTAWYRRRLVEEATRDKPEYSVRFKRWTRGAFHIQSLPTENPLLGPDYYVNLERKAPHVRDALLYGLWNTFEGLYYDMLNPRVHRIQKFKIPDEVTKFRFIDVGTNHPFVCLWAALFPPTVDHPKGRLIIYREFSVLEKWASRFKQSILKIEKEAGDKNIIMTICSFDAWNNKVSTEGDKTIGERFNQTDKYGATLNAYPGPRDSATGAQLLLELFSYESRTVSEDDGSTTLDITSPPFIYMFEECRLLWKSASNAIHDKHNSNDYAKTSKRTYYPGEGDDEISALRDGCMGIDLSDFLPRTYDKPRDIEWGRHTNVEYEETGASVFGHF